MDSEVRRRRAAPAAGEGSSQEKEVQGRGERIDRNFTLGLLLLLSLLAGGVSLVWLAPSSPPSLALTSSLDSLLASLSLLPREHAVVLDCGSTGSRVLAFSFHRHLSTGSLVLEEELWHEVKPGLSAHAASPGQGAASIASLLALARERIPSQAWPTTPVTLMATAGLRLLPPEQSEALLAAARATLEESGFMNRGVDIMSELDEGVFGWLTVNYLLGQLDNPRKSYVALDLGGGSTQVTFAPKHEATFTASPSDFLHPVKVSGQDLTLYSHSYLGLGLMSARETVFRLHDPPAALALASACVRGPEALPYRQYTVTREAETGFEPCLAEVQLFLAALAIDQVEELPTRKIAAFSYFHDRAVDAGMLGEGESGVVTVGQYMEAARKACSSPTTAEPFLCLDLTFIAGLLHHGYRLELTARLGLYKQIDGHQTSWALGAAFHLLE